MKLSSKIAAVTALAFATIAFQSVSAGEKGGPGKGGKDGGNRPDRPKDGPPGIIGEIMHNAEALKITPEEKAKLEALGKELHAKAEKGADREALRKDSFEGVKAILTPEQLAKLKEIHESHGGDGPPRKDGGDRKHGDRKEGGDGGKPPAGSKPPTPFDN